MDLSSAIITTEGGITQHAAQIAREHQIPCIVGVTDIIDGVEDGQPLSVDANLGRVEKITNEEYERIKGQDRTDQSINIVRRPLTQYHGPDIIWMDEAANKKTDRNLVGNKAANQIITSRMFNVPSGFILTTASYYQFMAV
jgi:phosphoenolpyruvate synthase/pyruvate phosphate dikinase